ncbi:MAG TPA: helix-turn-helix transcriptional regulator [Chitinophagaceae bacterium]|nr:helix-turn-helix transcriptional regulator [Chitinophagaceae bacterium]
MKDGIFLKEMGSKIKAARKAQKMSLEKLSKLSGATDLSNLWFIEQGRRNVHILTLKSIADVLKTNMKDLI